MQGSEITLKKTVLFLLGSFFLFVPIFGQTYISFKAEQENISKNVHMKIGPFRIFPRIQLKDIGYDGNVYYQSEEQEPAKDFTGTLSPELKIYVLFKHFLIFTLTENPEYVYYLKEKRERRWNNTFSPEFKWLLFQRFVLGGGYSHSMRRHRASSEFDVRANERQERYKGSFFYETARGTSLGLSGEKVKVTYEDITLPGQEIYLSRGLNRDEWTLNSEMYYRIFSESYLFLKAGYTDYNFLFRETMWRNSYSYQAVTGIRFPQAGGRLKGKFSFGYKKLIPRSEDKKSYSGFIGDTNLELQLKRLVFRLGLVRDISFSYWTNNVYFLENSFQAGVSYYLTRFFRLDYTFQFGRSKYPESIPQLLPDGTFEYIKRKDSYTTHTAGFAVRVIRNIGVGVQVIWWERNSNYFWENRKRTFIGGFVTYEF